MRHPLFSRVIWFFGGIFARPVRLGPAALVPLIILLGASPVATAQLTAQTTNLGNVDVKAKLPIPITVAGSPADLNNLANVAFSAHGRYQRVTGDAKFDLRFTGVAPSQVRVDISSKGASLLSQVVAGTSDRNALLRAADVAVKATSGLNGFFASQIAFVSNRTGREDIYTSDVFFSEVRQITFNGAPILRPRWSPDGHKLIYTSYVKGFPDIYLLDLPSMHTNIFVSLKGSNLSARFSPDGREVAMVLTGTGQSEIYTCDAFGRGITARTHSDLVKSSPAWSPDGTRLIYAAEPGPQLQIMSAGGGAPSRLATGLSTYCAEPDWSRAEPDKIAFTVRNGTAYQVAVCSLSGKTQPKIVSQNVKATDALEPAWLADGRHLICTARMANVRVLYLVDTETGKATRLSPALLGECAQASVWGP